MDIPLYTTKQLKKKERDFCLCIPIYNEGRKITSELQKANSSGVTNIVDIVLLDGGSTDGTTDIEFLQTNNVNTLIEMEEKGLYRQIRGVKSWI